MVFVLFCSHQIQYICALISVILVLSKSELYILLY